jgi:hypothetical protein
MHRQQHELLAGYGWEDEGKGIARIPIDEAMKRLAERGLPARPAAPAAAATPVPAPAAPAAQAPAEEHP